MAKFNFPPLDAGPPSRRNWYQELLDDPQCRGDPKRVQEAYETHRDAWRAKQIELFSHGETNPVISDQTLLKHLARQKRLRNGHQHDENDDTDSQEINCCVIWARPPQHVLNQIQTVQADLQRLVSDDLYLIPEKDLHLSVIELSHRHTVPQLRSVADEIGSARIQKILGLVSTLDTKPGLVAPTISFDKMGIAVNFLPTDVSSYTYHHLRSDMHAQALESGIDIDMCYTAPSAHITIGRFIGNKFFEIVETRKKFVQLVQDFNSVAVAEKDGWVVGESQGLEMQLGYLKFGRESSKADLVGKI
ncbi:uncharacterized protein M421DRAFT_244738 [Didymella exigua CBS 183.55]|uniref:Uncharacterized protein n=1 Tax=Didymella exigua CBS 183.55 TaxID=1150837 RepID=A0A6A5RYI6_9PLEO|nr:uncharacterized protein M421DRAFT_244738 [Didymella exigua CBS 183.55]KAF1932589.1 hypothetical protein M421DRAFT_244738 [Didymella exigua CBS 183.55]